MLSTLLFGSFHLGYDYVSIQWAIGILVAICFTWNYLSKLIAPLPSFVFSYSIFSALYSTACLWPMKNLSVEMRMSLAAGAFTSVLSLIAACVIARGTYRKDLHIPSMQIYTVLNSLYVFLGWLYEFGRLPNGTGYSGFLDYSGMNGTLIALGVPSLFYLRRKWAVPSIFLSVLAIVLSKASIPYGVLFVSVAAELIQRGAVYATAFGTFLVSALAVLGPKKHALLDTSSRFEAYKVFLGFWWKQGHWVLGNGLGSFAPMAPTIQMQTKFFVSRETIHIWPWLHSDWLQTIFELGIVGFLGYAALFFVVARKLWISKSKLFSLCMGLGAAALFNYPARYFVMAFLMAYVVCGAYNEEETHIVREHS